MTCDNCKNPEAYRLSYRSGSCSCDKCGSVPKVTISDVYFRQPYFDQNIAHDTKNPLGTHIHSREQKARVMKDLGIKESGDRRHGSR